MQKTETAIFVKFEMVFRLLERYAFLMISKNIDATLKLGLV